MKLRLTIEYYPSGEGDLMEQVLEVDIKTDVPVENKQREVRRFIEFATRLIKE